MGNLEGPKSTHGDAPSRSSHEIFPRFTLPGSTTALPAESSGFRPRPAPQGGYPAEPKRMGPGCSQPSVRPWDSWGPKPPWPSWVHSAAKQGGGLPRPPFPAGTGPNGSGCSSRSVQPKGSWGPRPPWPSWVHSMLWQGGGMPAPPTLGLSNRGALATCVPLAFGGLGYGPRKAPIWISCVAWLQPRDSWGIFPPWPSRVRPSLLWARTASRGLARGISTLPLNISFSLLPSQPLALIFGAERFSSYFLERFSYTRN